MIPEAREFGLIEAAKDQKVVIVRRETGTYEVPVHPGKIFLLESLDGIWRRVVRAKGGEKVTFPSGVTLVAHIGTNLGEFVRWETLEKALALGEIEHVDSEGGFGMNPAGDRVVVDPEVDNDVPEGFTVPLKPGSHLCDVIAERSSQ